MPKQIGGIRRPKVKTDIKSYSWRDLDNLGLPRDHFYRRFVEIGRQNCPNCGYHHIGIRRVMPSKFIQGWEWRCEACNQIWMTPNITPGLKKPKTKDQENLPEYDPGVITVYKY